MSRIFQHFRDFGETVAPPTSKKRGKIVSTLPMCWVGGRPTARVAIGLVK